MHASVNTLKAALIVAGVAFAATGAFAADYYKTAPVAAPAPTPLWDLNFSIGVTSDYISRGITQNDHKPAVQGSVELDVGMFYAGAWASNVNFPGPNEQNKTETDLSIGIRPVLGAFTFDIGYLRYLYTDSDSDFSEIYGFATWAINPAWSLQQKVYYNPDTSDTYFETDLAYTLSNGIKISGGFGDTTYNSTGLVDYISWNAGGSYTWSNNLTLDVRLWGTNLSGFDCGNNTGHINYCDTRVVATLSYATSWSKLMGMGH